MPTYSDEILRLAEITPIAIPQGAVRAELANQLCGDRVAVSLAQHDGVIAWVGWESEGCAILRASATYLSRTLSGKSLAEAADLVQKFKESSTTTICSAQAPLPLYIDCRHATSARYCPGRLSKIFCARPCADSSLIPISSVWPRPFHRALQDRACARTSA